MLPKRVLIIDNGSIYLSHVKGLFGSSVKAVMQPGAIDVTHVEQTFDLVVLSGGYQHEVMGSEEFYQKEMRLIKRARVPIIGICLGFQLIAHTFGIPVHKVVRTEHGTLAIHLTKLGTKALGNGPFHVYEDHRWVVSKTPAEFHALASSKDGIEAIMHTTLPLAGFQFHPEMFITTTDGKAILNNLLSKLSQD